MRNKKDATCADRGAASETNPSNETRPPLPSVLPQPEQEQEPEPWRQLSPLSTLVSKFITDNARKIHDSIEEETERRDFVFDLRETLMFDSEGQRTRTTGTRGIRPQRPPLRSSASPSPSSSSSSSVIDFLAETKERTLDSFEDDDERLGFQEHLTRELRKSFQQEMTMIR